MTTAISPGTRRAILVVLLLAFWLISLRHLTVAPPVYEDEPWQASTGWKLATAGVFGSDLFAGLYDMDRHYYHDHALTIARHPSETEERMMVRILAFTLYADEMLGFALACCKPAWNRWPWAC